MQADPISGLLPFFQWCDGSMVAQAIRNSRVAFPIIENFHLFALTVLLGTVVVMSLRQFNVALTDQSVAEVAAHLKPWNRWGLAVILVSGVLLFVSEANKCFTTTSFRVKMIFLFFALIFQFTVYDRLVAKEKNYRPGRGKVAAGITLFLWFGVGLAGRAIGFLG